MADNIQIANRIQNLMPHKFIRIAQAVGIQHIGVVNHNRVGQIAAQPQPVLAHHFHFVHKPEGARPCDFFQIRAACKINFKTRRGAVKHRMVEFNRQADFKPLIRLETHPFSRLLDFYRFIDLQKFFQGFLLHHTGILQQKNKRQAAAVHNRDFGRVQFNRHIINAICRQCRHNVFDCTDPRAVLGNDGGR